MLKKKIIGLHNSIYTNKTNINGNKTLNDGFFFSVKKFYLNKKGNFNSIKDGGGGGLKGVGGGCSGCCSKRPLLPVFPLFSSVCILCQSQIIELESRPPFKKCGFSGQILLNSFKFFLVTWSHLQYKLSNEINFLVT